MSTPNDQQPRNPDDDDRTISDDGSSPVADNDQTIADGAADLDTARGGSPSQSDNDQTLLNPSFETGQSSVAEGDDEQTIVADAGTGEETMADVNLAGSDEDSDGQTVGDQTQALPGPSSTAGDQTIADEAQPESADATIADATTDPVADARITNKHWPTASHPATRTRLSQTKAVSRTSLTRRSQKATSPAMRHRLKGRKRMTTSMPRSSQKMAAIQQQPHNSDRRNRRREGSSPVLTKLQTAGKLSNGTSSLVTSPAADSVRSGWPATLACDARSLTRNCFPAR
jgi:hypothetical protein